MWAIYHKEIRQFLNSLVAYIVIGVFLTGIGLLMWVFPDTNVLDYGYADLETLFTLAPFVYLFLIPAITMRLLAEERKSGTIELLMTRPVSHFQVILGKYFAAFTLVVFSLIPTLIYYYSVYELGNPVGNLDTPGIIGSYLGLVLLGAVFTAIGILSSSFSENQIVAFIIAVFLCFFLYTGIGAMARLFPGHLSIYIEELGIAYHYEAMGRGLIDSRNVVFFFSVITLMLLLTYVKLVSHQVPLKPGKTKVWKKLTLTLVLVIMVNALGANYFFRLDLTEEKRYSIGKATKTLLRSLDAPLTVDILIAGDLPSGFQRLQKSIFDMLEEFRVYAGAPITYQLRDPGEADTEEERNNNYRALMERGLSPNRVIDTENGQQVQKIVFPYAVLHYKGQAAGILMLKGNQGASSDAKLNQSIEGVEFELATGIQRLTNIGRKRVGIIQGHGELDSLDVAAFVTDMLAFYDIHYVDLPEKEEVGAYDAIIIAKPTQAFSKEDKYKIDQYLMKGGKAIFLIDALSVNASEAGGQGTVAVPYELGLTDLLFRYGVRLNPTLVQDLNFGRYPVVTDGSGTIIHLPWPFYASINRFSGHPITKNLDAVYHRFFGTIDTVKADGVRKIPLMFSSDYSRVLAAPVKVAFEDMVEQPDPNDFNQGDQPVVYLLEGVFTSNFKNRILPKGLNTVGFKEESVPTKILVATDGDLVRNERDMRTGKPYQLGYNPYADQGEKVQYANQDFLHNALAYMINEDGLITSRAKEIGLRPLDRMKIQQQRLQWQLINLVLPVLLLVVYGVLRHWLRIRKWR